MGADAELPAAGEPARARHPVDWQTGDWIRPFDLSQPLPTVIETGEDEEPEDAYDLDADLDVSYTIDWLLVVIGGQAGATELLETN